MTDKITSPEQTLQMLRDAGLNTWDMWDTCAAVVIHNGHMSTHVVRSFSDFHKYNARKCFPTLPDEFFMDVDRLLSNQDSLAYAAGMDLKHYMEKTCINQYTFWLYRDVFRFCKDIWVQPGFVGYIRERGLVVPECVFHMPHISLDDPTMVAYTPSYEYAVRDRQVRVKVGKYLQRFYGSVLSSNEIRDLVNDSKGYELTIESGAKAIIEVYENGPDSCMSGRAEWELDGHHPAEVYADSFDIAYIKTAARGIVARALVRKDTREYVRIYGDESFALRSLLNDAGYSETPSWEGAKLRRVDIGRGKWLMPYIDGGCRGVRAFDEDTWVITDNYNFWCDNTCGYVYDEDEDSVCCDCCGEYYDDDQMTYSAAEQVNVCSGCLDRHYVYAIINTYRLTDYIHTDNAVYCESNNKWYSESVVDDCGIVSTDSGWFSKDDCVLDVDGEWQPKDSVVAVGEGSSGTAYVVDYVLPQNLLIEYDEARNVVRAWLEEYMPPAVLDEFEAQEFITTDNGMLLGKRFCSLADLSRVHDAEYLNHTLGSLDFVANRFTVDSFIERVKRNDTLLLESYTAGMLLCKAVDEAAARLQQAA